MQSNATVTIRSVTTSDPSGVGDTTETTTDNVLEWALVAPRSSQERTDQNAPAVISAATVYGPFDAELDSDDLILISGHSAALDGTWQVDGIPGPWSMGDWKPGFEVAVKRTKGRGQ